MTRTILLLIGVLFMFLTYGCSQKEKQPIKYGMTELHHYIDTIDNTFHRNELQQIVSKMEAALAEFYHASINIQTSIKKLNRDYDAKREEIEAKFLLMDDAQTAMQQKTVASYFELKAKCSPTQWQRIRTIFNKTALQYFENQEL